MLSALLLILALPPWNLVPLGFLALAPLSFSIHRLPEGPSGRRAAAREGFLFAGAFWTVNLLWVLTEVAPRYSWAYPGFGLLILMLGGLGALFGLGLHRMARDRGWPLVLAVPIAWVGVEWIKGHVPFGLAFPWMGLGVSLAEYEFVGNVRMGVSHPVKISIRALLKEGQGPRARTQRLRD